MPVNRSLPLRARQPGAPRPAAPQPARPRLRVVSGDLDEPVQRRKRFEGAHPEIVITPPGTHACVWTARRDGKILASGYQLGALLDKLGWLLGQQPLQSAEASRGRDLGPGGNNRAAEEMAADVDAEAEQGWSRVGLHRKLKLSDPLDAEGLHHDDVAVTPVPGRRPSADEASPARVVGELDRSGGQVLAGNVSRSGREFGYRGGDIGDGPVPKA